MAAIALRAVSFTYPGQTTPALDGIDLDIESGAFFVLCGPSGSGKSTLLRQLVPDLAPHGTRTGEILLDGAPLAALDRRTRCQRIGFVGQSPEDQLVTDKVWHELAFGLESLGLDDAVLRRRVAETAAFFGIESWFHRDVADLSGGQKQLLVLAAALVTGPDVLILDEPTAQLDPIAAGELLAALARVGRELGTTIVMTEHRLEDVLPLATDAAVLDGGRLLCAGAPAELGAALRTRGHAMSLAMPTAMRVWAAADGTGPCPVTVAEGRRWLAGFAADRPLRPLPPEPVRRYPAEPAVTADGLWVRYDRDGAGVVRGLDRVLLRGELLALLGGNGAGKSTTLALLAGLLAPQRGTVTAAGRIGLLPQDPQKLFVRQTVREDLADAAPGPVALREAAALCRLDGLLDRHPYDLSGGEQQRAALAKLLLTAPDVLLLDEPTKGLDAESKEQLAALLRDLLDRGAAVLMVSHDVAFCARHAHRCALLFDGQIVAEGTPRRFFTGNRFYTTPADRIARGRCDGAVTPEDLIAVCGGTVPQAEPIQAATDGADAAEGPTPLPRWRRALAWMAGAATVAVLLLAAARTDLSAVTAQGLSADGPWGLYAAVLAALLVLAFATARPGQGAALAAPVRRRGRRGRYVLAAALILLLIPLTLWLGLTQLGTRRYGILSLLILIEGLLPFLLLYEGRRPKTRELVLLAALCAIGVAGRALFFMLPQCKPVLALTVVAGVALGGETGFLVGAMTMLTSNVLFGQGPWTPWQMFAMGLVGFLAGTFARLGWLRRGRLSLSLFGAVTALVVYGGIMDPAAALLWADELDARLLLSYYATGFPMDCVHAAASFLFLWLGSGPFLEKLDRVVRRYGLER